MDSPTRRKMPRQPLLTTTIIANNIHCSSCVSHIQDVIDRSSVSYAIITTNVSIVSGEIQLLHEAHLTIKMVCREISEAAFEVHSATTVDEHDAVVSELIFKPNSEGLIEEAAERVRSSFQRSSGSRPASWLLSTPLRNKRKRHIENCQACQSKEQHDLLVHKTPPRETSGFEASLKPISTPKSVPSTTSTQNTLVRAFHEALASPSPSPCDGRSTKSHRSVSQPTSQWSAEISISGMTCSSCTNAVNDALISLDAVKAVQVALITNSVTVIFEGDKSFEASLKEAVEDVGFEVTHVRTSSCKSPAWPRQLDFGGQDSHGTLGRVESLDSEATVQKHPEPELELFQARFGISGMTCSACANSVTDMLHELDCVTSATVTLLTNSADVVFESQSNVDTILNAIEDMGFDCVFDTESLSLKKAAKTSSICDDEVELPTSRSIQIRIDGFYCDHCPTRVVGQLERTYGDSIHIDKAPTTSNSVISLSYIPDLATGFHARAIIRSIQSVDDQDRFKASIYHAPSVEERSRQIQRAERRKLLLRLCASVIIVIPTFIIGVVCMSLLPSTSSTRQFFMEPVWAGQVPRAEWALFILATPVYFFVADVFHKRAIKEIRALWRPKSRVPVLRRLIKFGSMNLLVSAGTTVAYVASLAVLIMSAFTPGAMATTVDTSSSTYFDMVVFLTFFILIGRYLEAYSKAKAGDAVSMLSNLRPETAIVCENNGDQLIVSTDQLEIGDTILVRHGESPAADGVLLDTEGRFDASSLTGESRPVTKVSGDEIFTGTINLGPPISIKVLGISGASMLDQIIAVVREGQVRRAPIEYIADMITGYFVPVITLLAIVTFVVWVSLGYGGALDPKYLNDQQGGWAFWALEFAIAVFVVACPCGIGLAAPTALFVGGGLAAKHGILARGGGQAFQDAGKLDAIVFDKTGTLTEGGDLKMTNLDYYGDDADKGFIMAIAHKLETASSHPVAAAIATAAAAEIEGTPFASLQVSNLEEIPGNGIEGTFHTAQGVWTARIGSTRFMSNLNLASLELPATQASIKAHEQQAKTVALLATRFQPHDTNTTSSSYQLSAIFAIEDAIRPSAKLAVEALTRRGLDVYMVSGDNATTAHSVATRVGIKAENVFAGVLPTEKAATIEQLRQRLAARKQQGSKGKSPMRSPLRRVFIDRGIVREKPRRSDTVDVEVQTPPSQIPGSSSGSQRTARIAFVGDGINDAPALSRADISISPCNGSPIALTASQFILMRSSLMTIPELLDISTRVFRRVKFNFAWALVYNIVLVPIAAGVLFKIQDDGFRLGPVWGSLAMALSSVSVVVSSLLLRWEWKK